jgi:uncharacterized protein (TIGR01244 family)
MNQLPALSVNWLNAEIAVAPQLGAEQMAAVAALGFRSVINNRPDGEAGADQPTSASIATAATTAGLDYAHVPIPPSTHTPEDAEKMHHALQNLPKPVLAFCRSGNRSTRLYMAAKALDK